MMDFKVAFKQEAYELFSDLETSLLELEQSPEDGELIGSVFRAIHTIKGSGDMFGFNDIAAFAHEVETVLDLMRSKEISVTKELIDLTLLARDHIREKLEVSDGDAQGDDIKAREAEIVYSLRKLIPAVKDEEGILCDPAFNEEVSPCQTLEKTDTYRIRFKPASYIFTNGTNPTPLLKELTRLGECRVVAQTAYVPDLGGIDPEACYMYWDAILTTNQGINAIKDVFIFIEDDCELTIEVIDESNSLKNETAYKKLGEILVERGDLTHEDLHTILEEQRRIGEMLVNAGLVDSLKIQSALVEQEHLRKIRKNRKVQDSASTIRVPSDKLDSLVDLVGEMVTVQARLTQTTYEGNDPELISISEEVERLTGELRDNTMSLRMLPIGTTFSKFKRLVRDLSADLGKEVEMTTEGADTELDKTVIEQLNDPLVHLIRNCIDHGIEAPEKREAVGKPRQGTVHLSAVHSGANVLIRIMDDGSGLDREAIYRKALDRGLIGREGELTDKEVFELILIPGFSTAKEVTSVSGRGVGMDVVKKGIDSLHGSIDIDSKKGIGTTITLKLPLTLAIIEGLLVNIGQEHFALPLSVVEECVELTREDVANTHGRQIAHVRGEIVPYIRLREWFLFNGDSPDIEQIVITEVNGHKVGFVVDNVVGEHQTVIKTLGRVYRDVEGISGATILGDGSVALILDIPKLAELSELDQKRPYIEQAAKDFNH